MSGWLMPPKRSLSTLKNGHSLSITCRRIGTSSTSSVAMAVASPQHVLPVTPPEQVLGSCFETLRAEHLETEGVGEPVGRIERGADRQRVPDLLARNAGRQHVPHVLSAQLSFSGQLAEHPQRFPERPLDGSRIQIRQHRRDFRAVLVCLPRGRCVRRDAECRPVHLRHVCRHELPVAYRPGRGAAHRLMGEFLCQRAVEIRPVEDQLRRVRYRLPGEQRDQLEQQLGPGAVASASAAQPASYSRADSPTAAHITSSKTSSSLTPAARAAAKSASVTCVGLVATLPISRSSKASRPALLKARARCSDDAAPSPFRIRSCRARYAARFLSAVTTALHLLCSATAMSPHLYNDRRLARHDILPRNCAGRAWTARSHHWRLALNRESRRFN